MEPDDAIPIYDVIPTEEVISLEGAVTDTGGDEATHLFSFSLPNNPPDYFTPTQGFTGDAVINPWDFNGSFLGTADVRFAAGQTTTTVPLLIYDDPIVDGNATLIWTIAVGANFGFSQETYRFSEGDDTDDAELNGTIVNIPLSLNSRIKTAVITIEDDEVNFPPLVGDTGNDTLIGGSGSDIIYAGAGNDRVEGREGNDYLYGEAGNDALLGGDGNDYLNGGSGNDILNGGAGDDRLDGLTGDDSLYGSTGNDRLRGRDGNDYLSGGSGNDSLEGDAGNDYLQGGDGDDRLNGGDGSDTLIGGNGSDTYDVDSPTDTITEAPNQGTDTVSSSVSFRLGDNLENLTLTGSSSINGTGNALNNTIIGNNDNNVLLGGAGNDMLMGDERFSSDGGDDNLMGGAGNDTLIGGAGNDTLTGGAGADRFTFEDPYSGIDTITDFSRLQGEKIVVSRTNFTSQGGQLALGDLTADRFTTVTAGSAPSRLSDRFIYNSTTGALYWDFDGTSLSAILPSGQRQFATLSPGLNLIASDINVIA